MAFKRVIIWRVGPLSWLLVPPMRTSLQLISAISLALLVASANASQSLDLALDLAKTKAYRSKNVDWSGVERQARVIETKQGEDAAIRFVVSALADKHTFYKSPTSSAPNSSTSTPSRTQALHPGIAITLPSIKSIPVLQINRWTGKDQLAATKTVSSALSGILSHQPCGLVLDFSSNSGGNMWPMLIGLSPLLSEGRLGAFRRSDEVTSKIEKINGLITLDGKSHFLNYPPSTVPRGKTPYIAIIVGSNSASSGEITPLMFYGQKNVRFFGVRTSGFTSANQVFPLPNGGTLILTTSMTEDRNGHAYPDGIEPDVVSNQPFEDSFKWLDQQCSR